MRFILTKQFNFFKNKPMDEIINHIIIRIIKEHDFNFADNKAILLINEALEIYLRSILKTLFSHTLHAKKTSSNILYLLRILGKKDINLTCSLNPIQYQKLCPIKIPEFKSPLSTYLERYIHIYEFMPNFPPTHTFRNTFCKNKEKENIPEQVKKRLEQSLKTEKNLFKIIKASGKMPKFINYLYSKK